MAHDNGKISAPVSIRDVQLTLGEGIGVLAPKRNNGTDYDLCGSPNINIWSRIKPCRYDSLDKMQPHDLTAVADPNDPNKENIILANQTLTPITYGTTGIIFPTMMVWSDAAKMKAGFTVEGYKDQSASEYRHDYPTGWDGKHYYASRLQDFDGYNHRAPIPFSLDVSFGGRTFTATIGLNTNAEGVLAKTFDYNIYKNVIWRLAVAAGISGSGSFTLYYMKDDDVPKQNQYLYSNGFLGTMGDNQTSYQITGMVPASNSPYIFIGMLIGYKVTQTNSGNNQPITDKISPIWVSSTDNSKCGIPMPCSDVRVTSGYEMPSIKFANIDWMFGLPDIVDSDSPGVGGVGDYSIIITVTYIGGDMDYTYTGLGLAIYFNGISQRNIKIGSVTVKARETKNVEYYYMTNKTGVISVRAVLIKGGTETGIDIVKTIDIRDISK